MINLKCIQRQRSFCNNHLFLSSKSFSLSSIFSETPKKDNQESKKPLSVSFKESVGISEKTDEISDKQRSLLTDKLRNLSKQVRSLRNDKSQEKFVPKRVGKRLNLLTEKTEWIRVGSTFVKKESNFGSNAVKKESNFGSNAVKKKSSLINKDLISEKKCDLSSIAVKEESTLIYEELSLDMQVFARFLDEKGYFKDANFVSDGKLDLSAFRESYARTFLVSAAVKFGKDHQEIAKWLSASDLKKVANFGCPSLRAKTVRAAKFLREFFKTEEVKVCQSCVLKESCGVANKRSGHSDLKLQLHHVMRVIIMYAMENVPQQLVMPVPEEIKSSVSILLKEVMGLSKMVS